MRLDKTLYTKQSFSAAANHQKHYDMMNDEERAESFIMMMQAAFGFVNKAWPKMDKQYFQKRKRA